MKFLLLILISINAYSADYKLINFSSARLRTIDEILIETQISRDQLEIFKCSNPKRNVFFFDTTISNPKSDSFKIIGTDKKIYTYINGNIFSRKFKLIKKPRDSFLKYAVNALSKINEFEIGRKLVSKIQTAPSSFYLQKGGNRVSAHLPGERSNLHGNEVLMVTNLDELRPLVDKMPFLKMGYTGTIYWDPTFKVKLIEADYVERTADPVISLGHELVHAYDGMRGLLDRRFVSGDKYESATPAEYRAVYFENQLRKLMGAKYRRYYSKPSNNSHHKDLLDDRDEPILLPIPCINWL
jgi:hypothetical protein